MIVIEDNFNMHFKEETYVALGSFDGLHLGHMCLINKVIQLSKVNNAKSMVFTFKFHPRMVINKSTAPKILMDNESKLEVLKNAGLDIINMTNFNSDFMKISPEEFIVNLINSYKVKGLVVGFNYRFGYKNTGDVELLKKLSIKYKFSLDIIEPVKYNEETVSSSIIRKLISEKGDVKKAADMLTRPFMIEGSVIHGKKLGKELGFPTANLKIDKMIIIPKEGVYFTIVKYKDNYYRGITNVGDNPTTNDNKLSIETNILNFNQNIYDEHIKVYFIERIRNESKFHTLEDLTNQLKNDKEYAENRKLEINF
ncbi:riboflavin kinase/FMN adenylyltransferase [Clostridium algifaecis]|uniref:Riboflavin biosynthesis protein n=1 Tax=Clostridium algifaecis TaxID=1472040 RepID=A0ABS4KNR5_9CLOT|nr:bifunctional riboflavin kinase/FAD synthetase [Clostridium algifaecis]MBP2031673.1 riboflavin kinase/FMN adenylyltransferase [Clostridium algifaecis]